MGQPAGRRCTVAIAVLAAAVVSAGPGAGSGAGGGPSGLPESLDIAYSFAGGIHVMRPDGSGAVRLSGSSEIPASEPAWSPDGSRLALVRSMGEELSDAFRSRLELLDGTGERPLTAWSEDPVSGPAWSPDGRQLAFSRSLGADQKYATEIVVVPVDGGGERVVWRQRRDTRRTQVRQPVWSPDGAHIAFTRTRLERSFAFRDSLYVVDTAGGTPRRLASEASDAAWSPDGTRIAFSSSRDRNGKSCGSDECFYNDELYVMNADGSGPVRLTRNRGDDSSPSWSSDGRHIVFASDRNNRDPRGFNTEIYAIDADGSCLTWLTNGSPRSAEPSWRGRSAPSVRPACGPTPRLPRTEVVPDDLRARPGEPAVWLGQRFGSLLVSHIEVARDRRSNRSYSFVYDDCARFHARECARGLQLQVFSVCSPRSRLAGFDRLSTVPPGQAFVRRGVLYVDVGYARASVIAGGASVTIYAESGPGRPRSGLLRAGAALRPFASDARSLPAPGLPATLLRRIERAQWAFRRAGSVAGAARRLGDAPEQVRRRLALAEAVDALPRVRSLRCG